MRKKSEKKAKAMYLKNFKNFLKDESGNMTKENILKVGTATLAALSMFSGIAHSGPPPCDGHYVHTNDKTMQWADAPGGYKTFYPSHTHHSAHCSY
jgi:hypothetical protein